MLTVDAGLYLPPATNVTIYWMKCILSGQKKALKVTDIQYLYVPQYESLSIKEMLSFASERGSIIPYLPDDRDIHLLARQVSWIQTPKNGLID